MTPISAIARSRSAASAMISVGWMIAAATRSTSRAAARLDRSTSIYRVVASQLLPPGRIFDARPGSILWALCDAISRESSRIALAIDDLLDRLIPSAASSEWLAVYGADPAAVGAIDGPIREADVIAWLPTEWGGVPIDYAFASRLPSTAGALVAGGHLRSERSAWTAWLQIAPRSASLSSTQVETLLEAVKKAAQTIIPPTCALHVEITGVWHAANLRMVCPKRAIRRRGPNQRRARHHCLRELAQLGPGGALQPPRARGHRARRQ